MVESRFRHIVMNIVGGVDLLEIWRILGRRCWKRLFRSLVVLCDGDRLRPLAHVALSLHDAARKIMDVASAEARPMNIVPLEGSRAPQIVDSAPLVRRIPILRNEPFQREVISVGFDWLRAGIEGLVPPIREGVRWLCLFPYGDLPADLMVSPDFRALALQERGRGLVATCSLDPMIRDMMDWAGSQEHDWPFYEKWTYATPQSSVAMLCRELDVFAALIAREQGLVTQSIFDWIWDRWNLPVRHDVRSIARSQGIAEALEYAVSELSLWSMARRGGD